MSRKKKGIRPQFSKACKYVLGFEQGNKHMPFLLEACKYAWCFEMQLHDTEAMPQGEETVQLDICFPSLLLPSSPSSLLLITGVDWGRANNHWMKAKGLRNPNAFLHYSSNGKRSKEDCKNREGKLNPKPYS